MEAGSLRHRVVIQKPTPPATAYGVGGNAPTWTDAATVYAHVRPLRAQEVMRAQQAGLETTFVVKMRYTAHLTADCRLAWKGRYLQIGSAIDVNARGAELELLCHDREAADGA